MLQQLRLKNFKSLKTAQIDFGRVTVLIGPNGTGKSSIAQALLALKQSIGGKELRTGGPLINLGAFEDVLSKGASEREIGLGLSVAVAEHPIMGPDWHFSYLYDACFRPRYTSFDAVITSPSKERIVARWGDGRSAIEPKNLVIEESPAGQVTVSLALRSEILKPFELKSVNVPTGVQVETLASHKIPAVVSAIEQLVKNTYLVPAIRGLEQPDYDLAQQPATDFPFGKNAELVSTFAYGGSDVEELISIWSELVTGSELVSALIPPRKVAIQSRVIPEGIPLCGDGFGTNQLVQLLLTIAVAPRRSVVAIEEPEIHLHPKAQEKLCGLLAKIAKDRDLQILLTTHSERILYTLVSAVKDGTMTRDELAIYYFEERGKEPRRVEQDECGDIYDWGEKFF